MKQKIILGISAGFFIGFSILLWFIATNKTTAHLDLDSPGYDRIAVHFAQTGQLIDPDRPGVIPVQTMGYPLFLGILYALFSHNYGVIVIVQCLLSLLSGFLLYVLTCRLFNQIIAYISCILFSINIGYLIYTQFILTEIVLSTLLLAGIERLTAYLKNKKNSALISSALCFGFSVLVKPVALFYFFFLIGLLLWCGLYNRYYLQGIWLFILFFYMPITAYMIHNKIHFGAFTIAPVMHENILYYLLAKIIATDNAITYQEGLMRAALLQDAKDHNDPTRWEKPKMVFLNYLYEKPMLVISLWLHNMIKTLSAPYINQVKFLINPLLKGTQTSFFQMHSTTGINRLYHYISYGIEGHRVIQVILFLHLFYTVLEIVLLCCGLFFLIQQRFWVSVLFFSISILYFSFITGHDGCARYRMMFEYMYIMLASLGIYIIWCTYIRKRKIVIGSGFDGLCYEGT